MLSRQIQTIPMGISGDILTPFSASPPKGLLFEILRSLCVWISSVLPKTRVFEAHSTAGEH